MTNILTAVSSAYYCVYCTHVADARLLFWRQQLMPTEYESRMVFNSLMLFKLDHC